MVINQTLSAVGFGLDLTKRQAQTKLKEKGLPWERAKAFDGSAVFSDFVEVPSSIENFRLELKINDRLVQQGGVSLMINKPMEILAEVMSFMTFENGDILMTGTPQGVGVINKGDVFIGALFDADTLLIKKESKVIGAFENSVKSPRTLLGDSKVNRFLG